MNSTLTGRTQCQNVPVPDVGRTCSLTAKMTIATMASQKSGAAAPISEKKVARRSKTPPTRNAASEPMTIAATVTSAMVMTASQKVQTKASSTTSMAGRACRSD
ncbi:hypothetical protein ACVIRM_004871 [Rhizobium laguerreae]